MGLTDGFWKQLLLGMIAILIWLAVAGVPPWWAVPVVALAASVGPTEIRWLVRHRPRIYWGPHEEGRGR